MKKHLVKHKAKFKDCKNCLENNDNVKITTKGLKV